MFKHLTFSLLKFVTSVALLALLASCISGAPQAPGGSPISPNPFQDARSESCATTRGAEALYWDYMNGLARLDYPQTILTIPYSPGLPFTHPVQPLYSFVYPSTWRTEMLTDNASQLTGVNVLSPDAQAVWRRLNYTVVGEAVSARRALEVEAQGMLAHIGNPQNVETVCFIMLPDQTRAAAIIRAGNFTANVSIQVFVSALGNSPVTVILAQVALAPTSEYALTAVNVFFPLTSQLTPRGGTDPECSDGVDNDGDGRVDFPNDPGCSSPDDTSEAG